MISLISSDILYFITGSIPLLISFLMGLLLVSVFQFLPRFRNFFGLAFLALPGSTLLVFGLAGSIYSIFEIKSSIRQVQSSLSVTLKENESRLIQTLRVGAYLETSKILQEVADRTGMSSAQLYLEPSKTLVSSVGNFNDQSTYQTIMIESTDIDGTNVIWGKAYFQANPSIIKNKLQEISERWQGSMTVVAIAILFSTLLIAIYFFRHLRRQSHFVGALKKAVDDATTEQQLISGIRSVKYENPFLEEEINLRNNLKLIVDNMVDLNSKWMKNEGEAAVGRLAEQVAHDIRSPLSALNMIMSTLKDISDDKKEVMLNAILRINQIANDLLNKNRNMQNVPAVELDTQIQKNKENLDKVDLSLAIDRILSEKRIQFSNKANLEIEAELFESNNVFISGKVVEFERIVSNLLNNSVEALPNDEGKIVVSVKAYSEKALVVIKDNGKGMSQDILQKVGQKGFSYGKNLPEQGTGLGIFHAKRLVAEWGGSLQIQSSEGVGTLIELSFPRLH